LRGHCRPTDERRVRKRDKKSEKRCDLRRQEKMEREGAAVTCDGILFHRRAAETLDIIIVNSTFKFYSASTSHEARL